MPSKLDVKNQEAIERWLESPALKKLKRKIAVFDADGTLWNGDIGETFFRHQVEKKILHPSTKRPKPDHQLWDHYLNETLHGDAAKAYGWLAQWNEGIKEKDLLRQCGEFFESYWNGKVFLPIKNLIATLQKLDFEIWVVSGSMKWIVAAAVSDFGIPLNRVLGSAVEVVNGKLTGKIEHGVIPYRAGKATLIKKVIGERPQLAAGNTYWDFEMLELAQGVRIAIRSEDEVGPNYESEQKLKAVAEERGWLTQKF